MDVESREAAGPEAGQVHGQYSAAQLCRLLRLSPNRLRRWVRQGLVKPLAGGDGLHFDFEQLTAVRTLWALTQAGIPLGQIRRGLEQLRNWLPGAGDEAMAGLPVIERDGRLLVRLDEGLAEPSGQLQLDFAEQVDHPHVISSTSNVSAEECWDLGIDLEECGKLAEAEEAYRLALRRHGPNAQLCFNLGNVLHARGRREQAAERFQQAVELAPTFVEAWNNLGNVWADLKQSERAVQAYREALKHDPHVPDLHFNLADELDRLGRRDEARPHWRRYLALEPAGPWADHARKKIQPTG